MKEIDVPAHRIHVIEKHRFLTDFAPILKGKQMTWEELHGSIEPDGFICVSDGKRYGIAPFQPKEGGLQGTIGLVEE